MSDDPKLLLAFSTFPDVKMALQISEQLVTGKVAACASVMPLVTSIYTWNQKLERNAETLVLFKLPQVRYSDFESKLKSLHPYETPEIIAVPITDALPAYFRWVIDSCN